MLDISNILLIHAKKTKTDVQLNFTRYYSDDSNPGITAWAAVNMVENGVK
jgi:hypothetical protein